MCLDDDGELEISPRDELEISRELGSGDRALAPAGHQCGPVGPSVGPDDALAQRVFLRTASADPGCATRGRGAA